MMHLDLQDLGFDRGGALLVKRALAGAAGEEIHWVYAGRSRTCLFTFADGAGLRGIRLRRQNLIPRAAVITRGPYVTQRWHGAERAGGSDPFDPGRGRRAAASAMGTGRTWSAD